MKVYPWRQRSRLLIGITCLSLLIGGVQAAPLWWSEHGVTDGSDPLDEAVALQGQAKHVVFQAHQELETRLSLVGGAGAEIEAIITSSWFTDSSYDNQPLQLGQLKYLAQPFYDRLNEVGFSTEGFIPGDNSYYPWTDTLADDADTAVTFLGQLKFVFSFELSELVLDSDSDGLLDEWEQSIVDSDPNDGITDLAGINPDDDLDGDGLTNLEEFGEGKHPLAPENDPSASGYYYVDNANGSDDNSGDRADAPKESVSSALSIAVNQSKTFVLPGVGLYTEGTLSAGGKDLILRAIGDVTIQ